MGEGCWLPAVIKTVQTVTSLQSHTSPKKMHNQWKQGFYDEKQNPISRAYTPITDDRDLGHFKLVIKVYPDGKMSQHVKEMKVGESIDVRGPLGKLEYKGNALFHINRKKIGIQTRKVKKLGMLCGGTGITPMFQIIRELLRDGQPPIEISLVYANQTVDDILLQGELESYAKQFDNFKCYFTLDRPPQNWSQGSGFVTPDMIKEHLPAPADDSLILMCGPPPMMGFMEKNLAGLDFAQEHYFVY